MKLVSVYEHPDAIEALYLMMAQRLTEPGTNISHTKMPEHDEHVRFFASRPYLGWYFITNDISEVLGVTYISKAREIGIYIWPQWRRKGHAKESLHELMRLHPAKQYLANINPKNQASINLFHKMGFSLMQLTYTKEE